MAADQGRAARHASHLHPTPLSACRRLSRSWQSTPSGAASWCWCRSHPRHGEQLLLPLRCIGSRHGVTNRSCSASAAEAAGLDKLLAPALLSVQRPRQGC